MWDSNHGSLMLEASALPTAPQSWSHLFPLSYRFHPPLNRSFSVTLFFTFSSLNLNMFHSLGSFLFSSLFLIAVFPFSLLSSFHSLHFLCVGGWWVCICVGGCRWCVCICVCVCVLVAWYFVSTSYLRTSAQKMLTF